MPRAPANGSALEVREAAPMSRLSSCLPATRQTSCEQHFREHSMSMPRVHLFLDNSNIFISAQDEAKKIEGSFAKSKVRLQFDNLIQLALAGRPLGSVFVVGSIPPDQQEVWDRLGQATGVKPELYERGEFSGGEQGIDQCLQVHMLRAVSDHPDPQVAILMTGDGAGYDDRIGFHADLE